MTEAVNHHPVIAEHALNEPRRIAHQTVDIVDIRDAADEGAGQFERPLAGCQHRFELDDRVALEAMDRNVEESPCLGRKAKKDRRACRRGRDGQRIAQLMGRRRADHVLDGAAVDLGIVAEHGAGIRRVAIDLRQGAIAHEHAAMRLDTAWEMDRLAIAIRQVDGRFSRHL